MKESKPATKKYLYYKEVIIAVVGLLMIAGQLLLVGNIRSTALEYNKEINKKNEAASDYVIEAAKGRIKENQTIITEMSSYFADENNILELIKKIDFLKGQGLVSQFKFISEIPVKDTKTSANVLGFEVIFSGTKEAVDQGLSGILNLPFLIRSVVVEIDKTSLDGLVTLKYGGFIYVKPEFGKN